MIIAIIARIMINKNGFIPAFLSFNLNSTSCIFIFISSISFLVFKSLCSSFIPSWSCCIGFVILLSYQNQIEILAETIVPKMRYWLPVYTLYGKTLIFGSLKLNFRQFSHNKWIAFRLDNIRLLKQFTIITTKNAVMISTIVSLLSFSIFSPQKKEVLEKKSLPTLSFAEGMLMTATSRCFLLCAVYLILFWNSWTLIFFQVGND